MLKPPLRILIVAALSIIALITLVVREGAARDAGAEVLLAMEAIDPRSLLSGHYVIVSLRETHDAPCPPEATTEGPPDAWVALRPNGDVHSVIGGASTRAVAAQHGPVVVRGSFYCVQPTDANETTSPPAFTTLDLGIDRFHVNQADAQRIEAVLRDQVPGEEARVYAIVSIGRDGHARLKGLQVDGERIELNWL